MRELGYRFTGLDYRRAWSVIEVSYERAEPLTWKAIDELLEQMYPAQAGPAPLVLPTWLPPELRPLAESWAREHGWAGVVYGG